MTTDPTQESVDREAVNPLRIPAETWQCRSAGWAADAAWGLDTAPKKSACSTPDGGKSVSFTAIGMMKPDVVTRGTAVNPLRIPAETWQCRSVMPCPQGVAQRELEG